MQTKNILIDNFVFTIDLETFFKLKHCDEFEKIVLINKIKEDPFKRPICYVDLMTINP